MNTTSKNPFAGGTASGSFEDTLRLIAGLPAPAGLEDRVQARLNSAPRTARVFSWPVALRADSSWMRAAAAAAIVFVVAGGGWRIYSRVQPSQTGRAIAMPRVITPGGFSNAGAMRTPQTLNGPVLAHPVAAVPEATKPAAQALTRNRRAGLRRSKSILIRKATAKTDALSPN